jgi:hypothetical protein
VEPVVDAAGAEKNGNFFISKSWLIVWERSFAPYLVITVDGSIKYQPYKYFNEMSPHEMSH